MNETVTRVRIGTCANPAEATFIRSMFAARGMPVVIGAEHHASLLPVLGGGFLSLDIWVAGADAEDASALLRDLRAGGEDDSGAEPHDAAGLDDDDTLATTASAGDGDSAGAGDAAAPDDDDDALVRHAQARSERHRPMLALLLGAFVTFGTAHMVSGAWMRGVILAAIEFAGILRATTGRPLGRSLILAAIAADLVGALWRLRAARAAQLPVARIRRGG